jgi:catechol 2,3-dioxygenase-like lactoylglutathione lyase family enzyme
VTGINHVTLSVKDVKRSVDFYQGLFGMPIVSMQGETRGLRIGAGPQHLGISAAKARPRRTSITSVWASTTSTSIGLRPRSPRAAS